jgi:predicted nuclease of predicted toxin-antitoxin system
MIDENIPAIIIDWLRNHGHDLALASELLPGATDEHWLMAARKEGRILVTADKDFGELVFRERRSSQGIILLRLHDIPLVERPARLEQAWSIVEANPSGKFVVITSKRVRVRPMA